MSLRKAISEILEPGFGLAEREKAIDELLTTISKHLPEKKIGRVYAETEWEHHGFENFDKAIDEVNKLLTTNKKEEV